MEKAKKGDIKVPLLKAKVMKKVKMDTAKEGSPSEIMESREMKYIEGEKANKVVPSPMVKAIPMSPIYGETAIQSPMYGETAISPASMIKKPNVEGVVELGPTDATYKFSPVMEYLKKRGGK